MDDILKNIEECESFIRKKVEDDYPIGLILGSGLGDFGNKLEEPIEFNYSQLPHFPVSTVAGHEGKLIFGKVAGKCVFAFQGRFHYYEGYQISRIVFPLRVLAKTGLRHLIITNSAGGINEDFDVGDLMIIKDHINMMGDNPLRGFHHESFGERFPDMSNVYDPGLINIAKKCAVEIGLELREGVYLATSGPSYETPAEVKMFKNLGADVVGMSTVPEAVVSNQMGIKILGISCVTNYAAGLSKEQLSHEEVLETTGKIRNTFANLILNIIKDIHI